MSFISGFLAVRASPIETYSDHPAKSVRFILTSADGPTEFVVRLAEGRAETSGADAHSDVTVTCPLDEFEAVARGRAELFGEFWTRHLPAELFACAPGLATYFHPDHPYRGLNVVVDEIYATPSNYPTITPFPQAYKLHSLVVQEELTLTFEVGLAFGASALLIADAHRQKASGHHFAADPFQNGNFFRGKGLENVRRSGLSPYISWIDQRARPTLSGMRSAGVSFDMIYIDGDHSIPAVLSDFSQANAVLKVGGYLAFDDSHMESGVKVLKIVREHFDFEDIPDVATERFTLLRKRSDKRGSWVVRSAVHAAHRAAPVLEWGRNTRRAALKRPHH